MDSFRSEDKATLRVYQWNSRTFYQDPDTRGPYIVDDLSSDILVDTKARDVILDTFNRVGAPVFIRGIIYISIQYSIIYSNAVRCFPEVI